MYRPSQEEVLSVVKVNSTIWDASMEAYLPSGDQFISKAFKICLSSPFAFDAINKEEVHNIYQEAFNFALTHLNNENPNSCLPELKELCSDQELE